MTREARAALLDYSWPGNVRELENAVQRALALADDVIDLESLPNAIKNSSRLGTQFSVDQSRSASLKSMMEGLEKQAIADALARHDGRVAAAASELQLTRAGLYKKLNKYGLAAGK